MDILHYEVANVSIAKVLTFLGAFGMVFGGIFPYIPQYREIKRTEDADGFSLFVCLALLIANTLRIIYWFGKHFELPLLVQSFVMNTTMLVLVKLCVNVRNRNQIIKGRERTISDFDLNYFWAWTDFASYIEFLLVFSVTVSFVMYILLEYTWFVELVGFIAVFTEAMLGVPQLLRNHKNKSTEGLSIKMVNMWTVGDTFKTFYFVLRDAPPQFWLCGSLQICIDVYIICQVTWYSNNTGTRSKKQDIPD